MHVLAVVQVMLGEGLVVFNSLLSFVCRCPLHAPIWSHLTFDVTIPLGTRWGVLCPPTHPQSQSQLDQLATDRLALPWLWW